MRLIFRVSTKEMRMRTHPTIVYVRVQHSSRTQPSSPTTLAPVCHHMPRAYMAQSSQWGSHTTRRCSVCEHQHRVKGAANLAVLVYGLGARTSPKLR